MEASGELDITATLPPEKNPSTLRIGGWVGQSRWGQFGDEENYPAAHPRVLVTKMNIHGYLRQTHTLLGPKEPEDSSLRCATLGTHKLGA
jgi:hypothetical protein